MNKSLMMAVAGCLGFMSIGAQATVSTFSITQVYNQVVYNNSNPDWDTTFTGTFNFDSVTNTVSNFNGVLTQAMTGNTATRNLSYQLSSVYDATLGGLIVSVFYQNTTDVFMGGGFAIGGMKEYGNQNAYVSMFLNISDPTATLSDAQLKTLAYGDCTSGSLMGMSATKTCMTGWAKDTAGVLGKGGTMQGTWPITQTITAVPEPESIAFLLAGLPLIAAQSRRKKV